MYINPEVIRELSDSAFCHIVEPEGMHERYRALSTLRID